MTEREARFRERLVIRIGRQYQARDGAGQTGRVRMESHVRAERRGQEQKQQLEVVVRQVRPEDQRLLGLEHGRQQRFERMRRNGRAVGTAQLGQPPHIVRERRVARQLGRRQADVRLVFGLQRAAGEQTERVEAETGEFGAFDRDGLAPMAPAVLPRGGVAPSAHNHPAVGAEREEAGQLADFRAGRTRVEQADRIERRGFSRPPPTPGKAIATPVR